MMPEGAQGYLMPEPSWDLRVFVPDLQVERTLRVRGDMHIGGVMLKLVEELDISIDWSDHALWWPKKNCWLTKTRQTLNHHGVQADSFLNFTPMHKPLTVQLPDLRYVDARVDFSVDCLTAVNLLCKELGIRHSEELSFCRPLSSEHLKKNYQNVGVTPRQRPQSQLQQQQQQQQQGINSNTLTYGGSMRAGDTYNGGKASPYVQASQAGTIDTRSHSPDITSTLSRHASYRGFTATYSSTMLVEDLKNLEISNSPHSASSEAKGSLLYPKSIAEKARLNSSWLDSHLSLYQQNVRDGDTLQLRFKYREFYDLNPKLDMARINQIYEQAKWSLLTEEVECSEEEMMLFGALQYQIQQQASNPIPEDIGSTSDDIDAALTELQLQLEGGQHEHGHQFGAQQYGGQQSQLGLGPNSGPRALQSLGNRQLASMNQPLEAVGAQSTLELCDSIRFMRLRKFTFKTFKRLLFVFRDTTLSAYRNKEERLREEAAFAIDLRGCDVTPDVYLGHSKFGAKLSTPSLEGVTDYLLRFDTEQQYGRWMAAFRLAARGRPLSDPSYEEEVRSVMELFSQPAASLLGPQHQRSADDANQRQWRQARPNGRPGRSAAARILEARSGLRHQSATECKLDYIRAWRELPDLKLHYFVVRFEGSGREEVLGVASDRLVRVDAGSGEHQRVWPYARMKTWRVNWDSRTVVVQSEEGEVALWCLSADCKILHEFIGGYVFLSMRSKNNNQTLNEDLFYKLTRGWDD